MKTSDSLMKHEALREHTYRNPEFKYHQDVELDLYRAFMAKAKEFKSQGHPNSEVNWARWIAKTIKNEGAMRGLYDWFYYTKRRHLKGMTASIWIQHGFDPSDDFRLNHFAAGNVPTIPPHLIKYKDSDLGEAQDPSGGGKLSGFTDDAIAGVLAQIGDLIKGWAEDQRSQEIHGGQESSPSGLKYQMTLARYVSKISPSRLRQYMRDYAAITRIPEFAWLMWAEEIQHTGLVHYMANQDKVKWYMLRDIDVSAEGDQLRADDGFTVDPPESLEETAADQDALQEIARSLVRWLLQNLEPIRSGQIGGDMRAVGTIESMTGFLKTHKKSGKLRDIGGMDAVSLENVIRDTRVYLFSPLPKDAEGAYSLKQHALLLDLDSVKASPPKMENTIVHELRHALDLSKSRGRVNTKKDQIAYTNRPMEINARFTEALNDIQKALALMPDINLPVLIQYAFHKHQIEEIFPTGTESPRYRQLVNRVYKQLQYNRDKNKK